jgi:hypothetical protein
MPLERYSEKRTFDRTPEPRPDKVKAGGSGALQFCAWRSMAS